MTDNKTMKLRTAVSPTQHRVLKRLAAIEGRTMSSIVRSALLQYIAQRISEGALDDD